MSEADPKKIGKWMFVLAWVCALLLLTLWFDDLLESQFNPNQSPQSLQTAQGTLVVLQQNRQGHYVTAGTINNRAVTFLLDTGATQVSVPAHLANELHLSTGYEQRVNTANGTIAVYATTIDTLTIGDIVLHDVKAHLNPAINSDEILLGMSALRKLNFQQQGNSLILTQ
ncbi:TIGR02281 family clan AA aspartic protease [Alteromonadaceae bacterium BrNp21-10]|nr:TIGR02281 family clan AA aspartic protease [Alteromonadaceae bacterium BrNp21-10]